MAQAEALTLTTLLIDIRARLLEALSQPPGDANQSRLTDLWRVCLTVHDFATARNDRAYIRIMERMIDSIADYRQYDQPEMIDWMEQIPSVAEIETAAPSEG